MPITETTIDSPNEVIVLEAAREGLSVKVTLSGDRIGQEMLGVFRGKPKVKADIIISSDNNRTLARFLEEFKDCLFKRVARGGG